MARPSFKPTAAQRRTVAVAAGGGMNHEEIALGLGISRPTLEKHFGLELSIGAMKKRLEVYDALHRAAKKGNVTAARAYIAMDPKPSAPPMPAPSPVPALTKGKKEAAQEAAKGAQTGTGWDSILPVSPGLQ